MKLAILLFTTWSGNIAAMQMNPPTDPLSMSWNISQTSPPTTVYNTDGEPVMGIPLLLSNREYDVKVFQDDCETSSSVPDLDYHDSISSTMGFIDVDVDLTINQADIEASDIWNTTSELDGSFSFCLSTSLYLNETKTEDNIVRKQNFIFNVDVDKRAGFNLSSIATFIPNPEVNDDFIVSLDGDVIAYQCDPNTLDPLSVSPALQPFDILNICLEETSNINITINNIQDLSLEQSATFTSFVAIVDGSVKDGYEEVVSTSCVSGKCLVQIILINAFFSSAVASPIDVTGSVILAFGNSRRLVDVPVETYFVRGTKENEEEERQLDGTNVEFELTIDLRQACEGGDGVFSSLLSNMFG